MGYAASVPFKNENSRGRARGGVYPTEFESSMQHLLQFGLSNAVAAAVLAVLAAVATRVWRNPHFAYALWFVVLLRLMAPPLVPRWRATAAVDGPVCPRRRAAEPRGSLRAR